MERLTKRIASHVYYTQGKYEDTLPVEMETNNIRSVLKKLAEYEDLEEQGLLLRLPCKVGDDVYQIPSKVNYDLNVLAGLWRNNRVYHQKVARITITDEHWFLECDKDIEYGTDRICLDIFFKKTWFLSEEEAEQALERMEKEK